LQFQQEKPQIRMVSSGVILPNSDGLIFPFEAINLNAVLVEVFKIYDNNILQFLQSNDLNGDYRLEQVGRVIHQEKISLKALDGDAVTSEWHRYALDLSKLLQKDPNAIYQVRLGFKPGYSNYFCGDSGSFLDQYIEKEETIEVDEDGEYESIWSGWYGLYGYYEGYDYSHRDNPCYPAYYSSNHFTRRNVIASNLGIIAKKGQDKSMVFAVTDIRTAKPVSGAKVEIFDYQQQVLKSITTDANGLAETTLQRQPFVAVASSGEQVGYLKLQDGNGNSLSRFSISGVAPQKGLKGYIYGERGVWRPGDSLYLNFVLEDKANTLPADYPITLEVYDPNGQLKEKRTTSENVKGVYPIFLATNQSDPTGNWRAYVKVGGATFDHTLKVETIKPNRLKTQLDLGKDMLTSQDEPVTVNLQVNWLHGAPGQNLRTVVEYQLSPIRTKFDGYGDFVFDDPARELYTEPKVVFDGQVDDGGKGSFETTLLRSKVAPGKLKAKFKTRAFEKGGDFSTNNFSVDYSPYKSYVGLAIPKNKYNTKRIEINQTGKVEVAVVDESGKPIKNRKLRAGLYRVNWRWWWDSDEDYLSEYASANHYNALQNTDLQTDSKGNAAWDLKVDNWGRYMVRICDEESGHCTGDFFYAGYPWYDEDGSNRDGAAMLAFNSSKEKYEVGETIELRVPASADSRVLITLENGTKVIKSYWENAVKGDNSFTFKATADMTPNIYAHVSLIQPHAQTENDLPIRMYGLLPITVVDPKTKLDPQIAMPDELAPEKEFTVEVSEKNGTGMAYTLAVVDDGLLDLTNFKTPNPWDAFYAKEALGVQTFDIYNNVIGAYGSTLERLLSIGGDDAADGNDKKDQSANRFKPVVLQAGPFYLKPGQKVKHTFTMPNYVGSVRTMLVASNKGAYGAAEKTTPVKQPLMILATLPRVLGPGEKLSMPVAVFAMDEKVKNVNLSVKESSGLIKFPGGNSQSLAFSRPGEKMAYFDLEVEENVGVARFTIQAKGNGFEASQEIELYVRNPNPFITSIKEGTVKGR
ncbi:MAG: alpha-2-macroglobulin, partial [Phaeodactylibacter sp.]|nr:alpha-2-macroglobulin [Phaeodactylibacter sp.]